MNGNCFVAYIKNNKDEIYRHHCSPITNDDLHEMIGCLIENILSGYAYSQMIVSGEGKTVFSICADDLK